jgi:predicted pyridoxine 5'-phosphate oxidase superfamily flavin-nucleotide-binding protein
MGAVKRFAAGLSGVLVLTAGVSFTPVLWSEAVCRAEQAPQVPARIFTAAEDQRVEARTAFVVPEWEIVFAYEDYAHALSDGDAHAFDYMRSIRNFWSTLCAARQEADRYGDPGAEAKTTIYTIGISFTLEMMMKGLYEESVGRLATLLRSDSKTPQDIIEYEMAQDYSEFLLQTPWYEYPFTQWVERLDSAPMEGTVRGWERRVALGIEWRAKAAYARAIKDAVSTMVPDKTTMKLHVTELTRDQLTSLSNLRVLREHQEGYILEVDRYRLFTQTVRDLSSHGGVITEIAGNDDILISLLSPKEPALIPNAVILRQSAAQGSANDRFLVRVKVSDLTDLVRGLDQASVSIVHIYDY